MGPSHRRADDAGTAPRVGATGAGGARGDAPVRDRQPPARGEPDRGADRDRRLGRGRQAQRRRAPRHHLELPVLAAHHSRRRRDRPRRARRRASAPRGGERHPARGPRARPLRRLPRRARPLGAPLDRRGSRHRRGSVPGTPARGCADPRPAVRQGTPRAGGAGSARTRPPRRRRRPRPARVARGSCSRTARRAAAEASAITPNTAGWRPWPRPSTSVPAASPGPSSWSDAADTWEQLERPPLAAYCRWRQAEALVAAGAPRAEASVPLREAYAVAARIGAQPLLHELELLAERARLDLDATGRGPTPREAGPRRAPRADAARGGSADARRPRPHQPRDRRRARDQRQDRRRARLAHPAQARCAEPGRSGRNRAPPLPATRPGGASSSPDTPPGQG